MRQWLSSVVALAMLSACGGQAELQRGGDDRTPPESVDVPDLPAADETESASDDGSMSDDESASPPPIEEPSTLLDAELMVSGFRQNLLSSEFPGPEHAFEVVRDAERLSTLWRDVAGTESAAAHDLDIDFESSVVIFVDLGTQPGIWKYITGVAARQFDDRVEVEVVVGTPDYCAAAAALSFPYAFARVPLRDLPYTRIEREELPDCFTGE